jgi:hypothetical protein
VRTTSNEYLEAIIAGELYKRDSLHDKILRALTSRYQFVNPDVETCRRVLRATVVRYVAQVLGVSTGRMFRKALNDVLRDHGVVISESHGKFYFSGIFDEQAQMLWAEGYKRRCANLVPLPKGWQHDPEIVQRLNTPTKKRKRVMI